MTTNEIDWDNLCGRVVVLGFWTVSSEASWAHLARLGELAETLGSRVTVLAVHSPRLEYEKDPKVVADVVARAGIRFPVIHDKDLKTWNAYSPGGWPATVVVDHLGDAVGLHAGVADVKLLTKACRPLVLKAQNDMRPSAQPLPMPATVAPGPTNKIGHLAWPSGLALLDGDHLAVVDSGHDRLIVFELRSYVDGKVVARAKKAIGGLDNPRSICALSPSEVAVSLPDKGRVVAVNTVTSSAGIIADDLGRPRGLAVDGKGSIVVADAGRNQLLKLRLGASSTVLAGSGQIGHTDGHTGRAKLAEPASVIVTQAGIVFLDSASANLRLRTTRGVVRTTTTGAIETEIEPEAGLVDGNLARARLQNPQQIISLADGSLIVVDTGNNRLRKIEGRDLTTVGVAGFFQPEAAIVLPDGRLIVADTGNHRLVVVDLKAQTARELELKGVPTGRRPGGRSRAEMIRVKAGSRVSLNYPAPGSGPWEITVSSEPAEILGQRWTLRRTKANGQVSIPMAPHVASTSKDGATNHGATNHIDGALIIETQGTGDRAEAETARIPIRLIG